MSLPHCLKWKCVGSGESLSRKSSTPEQTLCLEAVRTAAWYKGSHLNSGSSSVSDSSLISLAAGWEDFLKPQTWMSSFLPQPERLRQSRDGLRPPRTWGASFPAGNGTLSADSTSSVACGLSTVKETGKDDTTVFRYSWLISHVVYHVFLSVEV